MSLRRFVAPLALLFTVVTTPLSAQVIANGQVNGLGTFVDQSTGYTWLRLDNFFGQSHNQMVATANAAGFQLANLLEVQTLWASMPNPGLNFAALKTIIGGAPNRDLFWGIYTTGNTNEEGWGFAYAGDADWYSYDIYTDRDVVQNGGGAHADLNLWAYQATSTVPEPGTVALLSAGLLALGFARRRMRA